MEENYLLLEKQSEFLKALANPIRLCILKGLLQKGECNGAMMLECLKIPQSTLSQNMNKLKSAGIVAGRREGNEIYYHIIDQRAATIIEILKQEI